MGFVHHEQVEWATASDASKQRASDAFGSNVEQEGGRCGNPSVYIPSNIETHFTGQGESWYSFAGQRRNLILHQGNKRRNDNRQPTPEQGRHLERDGLTPACRHQNQTIPPTDYLGYGLGLLRSEVVVLPDCAQDTTGIGQRIIRLP